MRFSFAKAPKVDSIGCVRFYTSNLRLFLEPYFVLKDDGKVYEWQLTKPDGFFLSV